MESVMLNIMYDAPSMDGLVKVVINKQCIEDPSAEPEYVFNAPSDIEE
jgi:ATP-dependent protease Clp ATPase subunit